MILSLAAAASENNVIGKNNWLPWELPAELKYFRSLTRGKPVIMGRKTMDSIVNMRGSSLPDRPNIVVTRNPDCAYPFKNVYIAHSMEEALEIARSFNVPETVVIGGSNVYKDSLPYADVLYLTRVHTVIDDGDAFFPAFDETEWNLKSSERYEADTENPISFTKMVYEKKEKRKKGEEEKS